MCIYKTAAVSGKKMEVSPTDNTNNATVGRFMVDMGFKGWRWIWVSCDECKESEESLGNKSIIETVDFVLNHQDTIYIDLLEFVPSLAFQSRDKIVPPFTKFGSKYKYWHLWQKSYYSSQQLPTATPKDIDPSKISSLSHIESRLRNFYCDEKTTTYDFSGTVRNRWNALKESVDRRQFCRCIIGVSGVPRGPYCMCKTKMATCALRIKCCVLESCCSFDGSFPSLSTWCQK